MVRTLAAEPHYLSAAQAEIERLRLIVQKLQRSQFGPRAERLDDGQLQLSRWLAPSEFTWRRCSQQASFYLRLACELSLACRLQRPNRKSLGSPPDRCGKA
jgi:hypothetical protein